MVMKQQTVVNELIAEFEFYGHETISGFTVVKILKSYLPKEKQQIIDAVDGFPLNTRHLSGDDYYSETFNQD